VDTGRASLSLGEKVQDREKRFGNRLQHRDRSTGGHGGPGFFCGLPHRWKYFSDSSCHRYVPTHYRGPGCSGAAGEIDPAARPWAGLCSRSLRAAFVLGYEYPDLVRTRHRGPGLLGDRWAVSKALYQSSLGRDGARMANGRVLPAGPLALSSGIDSHLLEAQPRLCPAEFVSERTGRVGAVGCDETWGQGLDRSALYSALSLGHRVTGSIVVA
jgi:hypothetical protein